MKRPTNKKKGQADLDRFVSDLYSAPKGKKGGARERSLPLRYLTLEEMHKDDRIILAEDINAQGEAILDLVERDQLGGARNRLVLLIESAKALLGGGVIK